MYMFISFIFVQLVQLIVINPSSCSSSALNGARVFVRTFGSRQGRLVSLEIKLSRDSTLIVLYFGIQ